MTRIIACLLVGVMLAVSSCSDKNSIPAGVLPHEKMEAVMWDVIQSEQYSASYLVKDSARIDLKLENLRLYDEVFRLHQVSREEFRKSYLYYMGRADLSQVLFDSLLAKGNRLRTESYSRSSRPVTATPGQATPPAAKPGAAPVTAPVKSPGTAPVNSPATRFPVPTNRPVFRDSVLRRHPGLLRPGKTPDSAGIHRKIPA
ncbi:MAG TPA: DUF4296 domain-containing protein [Puia sp.]|nr:DUF4296 domain-containing protein [Puia sp.]